MTGGLGSLPNQRGSGSETYSLLLGMTRMDGGVIGVSLEGQKLLLVLVGVDADEKALAGCDMDGCKLASKAVNAAI